MDATFYQQETIKTAIYTSKGTGSVEALAYLSLGLAGESGEFVECVKKLWRNGDSEELREKARKELGDVMWHIARLADELNIDLSDVLAANLAKTQDRFARGVIAGVGENR